MFSFVDNKSIVADQGPEVSNSKTETCPTNPEGGEGYIYIYIDSQYKKQFTQITQYTTQTRSHITRKEPRDRTSVKNKLVTKKQAGS